MRILVPEFVEDTAQEEPGSGRRMNARNRSQVVRNAAGGSGGAGHDRANGPANSDAEQTRGTGDPEKKPSSRERPFGLRQRRNQAAAAAAANGASGSRRMASTEEEPSAEPSSRAAAEARSSEGPARVSQRENVRERTRAAAATGNGGNHGSADGEAMLPAGPHERAGRRGGEVVARETTTDDALRPTGMCPEGPAESDVHVAVRGSARAARATRAGELSPAAQTEQGGEPLENDNESPQVIRRLEAPVVSGPQRRSESRTEESEDDWASRVRGILEQVNRAVTAQMPPAAAAAGGQALPTQPGIAQRDTPDRSGEQGDAIQNGVTADAAEGDRSPFGEPWSRVWARRAAGAGATLAGPSVAREPPREEETQAEELTPQDHEAEEQTEAEPGRHGREGRYSSSRSISPCPAFSGEAGAPERPRAARRFGAGQGSGGWSAAEIWEPLDGSPLEVVNPMSNPQRASPPSRWPRPSSPLGPPTQASVRSSVGGDDGPPAATHQASRPLSDHDAAPASGFGTLSHYLDSFFERRRDSGFVSTQSSTFSQGNRPSPAPAHPHLRAEPSALRSSPEAEPSPGIQGVHESSRSQGPGPSSWFGSFRSRSSQERAPPEGRGSRRSPSRSLSQARYRSSGPRWLDWAAADNVFQDSDEDVNEAIRRSLESPFSRPGPLGSPPSRAGPSAMGSQEGRTGASGAGASARPPSPSEPRAAAVQPRSLGFSRPGPPLRRAQALRGARRVERLVALRSPQLEHRQGRPTRAATLHEPRVLQATGGPGGAHLAVASADPAAPAPDRSDSGRRGEPGPDRIYRGPGEEPQRRLDVSHGPLAASQGPSESQGGAASCAVQSECDEGSAGSAKRRKMTVGADAADLLECPVCYEIMRPPIFQCQNGHVLCSSCVGKVAQKCPSCRQATGHIRNLALEKFAASAFISCSFSGCTASIAPQHLDAHEEHCQFRPLKCLAPHCAFEAESEQRLCAHLVSTHAAKVTRMQWEGSSGLSEALLMTPHGKIFAVIEASGNTAGLFPADAMGSEGTGNHDTASAEQAGPRFAGVIVRDPTPENGSTLYCLVATGGALGLRCSLYAASLVAGLDEDGPRSVLEAAGAPLKAACHEQQLPMGLAIPPSSGHASLWVRVKLKGPALGGA